MELYFSGSRDLPFSKKKAVELLKATYASNESATMAIPAAIDGYYRDTYPEIYKSRRSDVERTGRAVAFGSMLLSGRYGAELIKKKLKQE